MMRRLLIATAIMALALTTANCAGAPCPCGADPNDPIELHDPSFNGNHQLDHACSCQCGDDKAVGGELSKIGACVDHGKSCNDRLGRAAEVICIGPASDF